MEDFHNFWNRVTEKQMKFRNEFFEVKCDGTEREKLPRTEGNQQQLADNEEESLMELKFVPLMSWNEDEAEVEGCRQTNDDKARQTTEFEAANMDDGHDDDDGEFYSDGMHNESSKLASDSDDEDGE